MYYPFLDNVSVLRQRYPRGERGKRLRGDARRCTDQARFDVVHGVRLPDDWLRDVANGDTAWCQTLLRTVVRMPMDHDVGSCAIDGFREQNGCPLPGSISASASVSNEDTRVFRRECRTGSTRSG